MVTKTARFQPSVASAMVICELFAPNDMEYVLLSAFAGFVTVLWGLGMKMLYSELAHQVAQINMKEPQLSLSDEIKQELYDLLSMALDDTVGNMKMPNAWDHLLGAASAFAQKKFMSGIDSNVIEGLSHLADHGNSQIEEENDQAFTQ